MSLGVLAAGQPAQTEITLRNTGSDVVVVERVETSCPCLQANPLAIQIAPGETAALKLMFDPSDEPDFRGGLSIEVIGRSALGEVVFRTRVDLDVRADAAGTVAPLPRGTRRRAAKRRPVIQSDSGKLARKLACAVLMTSSCTTPGPDFPGVLAPFSSIGALG